VPAQVPYFQLTNQYYNLEKFNFAYASTYPALDQTQYAYTLPIVPYYTAPSVSDNYSPSYTIPTTTYSTLVPYQALNVTSYPLTPSVLFSTQTVSSIPAPVSEKSSETSIPITTSTLSTHRTRPEPASTHCPLDNIIYSKIRAPSTSLPKQITSYNSNRPCKGKSGMQ
jgi:hypothetical protein